MSFPVTNEKRRAEYEKLLSFAASLKDGQRVSWLEVTQASGVKMDRNGQALCRLAMRRAKRPYLSLPGLGFEVSSPTNALEIVGAKTRRFVGALKIARDTTTQVSERHINELTQEHKNKLLQQQAIFDTLGLSASLAKRLPEKVEGK